MRFLIYDTELEAQKSCDDIYAMALQLFVAQGFTVIGGRVVLDESNPDTIALSQTVRWDEPTQRLDGKWVVAHPEKYSKAQFEFPDGSKSIDYVMAALGAVVVEEDSTDWFPQSEEA